MFYYFSKWFRRDAFTAQSLLEHSDVSITAKKAHNQIETKRKDVEAMTKHIIGMSKKIKLSNITRILGINVSTTQA